MGRKRKPIKKETKVKRVKDFIQQIKYLRDPKYYKNNLIVVAHFESTVAREGACRFCGESPQYSVFNKRITHNFIKRCHGGYFCYDCLKILEEQIGTVFEYDYCP